MELRLRLIAGMDRALAALLASTLVGATLAFGGAVWWARTALGGLVALIALAMLARSALSGRLLLLKSPLAALGLLALGLALVQLAPLPSGLVGRLSSRSEALHAEAEAGGGRATITVDRPATLRWLAGGAACLAVFCAAGHFADRVGRLRLVWGSVVAAFGLCTVFGAVQACSGSGGLYGWIQPGQGPPWAPTLADSLSTPGSASLRLAADPDDAGRWAVSRPGAAFEVGPLMGGPGAFLAMAALALPLTLGLVLQALAPRGSREGLLLRLHHEGGMARVALLSLTLLGGSALAGYLGGVVLGLPIALGLALAGLASARGTGVRWSALGLTASALAALAAGNHLGGSFGRPAGADPLATPGGLAEAKRTWVDAARVARDFPLFGSGLGSFATVFPHYKARDVASTTAQSSLLQWWAEAGWAGAALLAAGGLWCLRRLPSAVARVGSADRPLAWALVGATVGFGLMSAIHWTIQLSAVALAACAVGGTLNRWLAGGTDLFLETH